MDLSKKQQHIKQAHWKTITHKINTRLLFIIFRMCCI